MITDYKLVDCVKQKAIKNSLLKKFGARFVRSKTKWRGAPASWNNNSNIDYFSNWNVTNTNSSSIVPIDANYSKSPSLTKYKFRARGGAY